MLLLRRDGAGGPTSRSGPSLAAYPDLIRDRAFLGYALALSFTTASFFVFIAGAPYVVVEDMGHSPDVYGLYFILNAAGYMVGNFLSGRFGQRLGSERLILIGTSLSVVAVVLEVASSCRSCPGRRRRCSCRCCLNAVGNGLTIPGGTALALSVRPELAGTAAGLIGATQLGLGALGSVDRSATSCPLWPSALVVAHARLRPRRLGGCSRAIAR